MKFYEVKNLVIVRIYHVNNNFLSLGREYLCPRGYDIAEIVTEIAILLHRTPVRTGLRLHEIFTQMWRYSLERLMSRDWATKVIAFSRVLV